MATALAPAPVMSNHHLGHVPSHQDLPPEVRQGVVAPNSTASDASSTAPATSHGSQANDSQSGRSLQQRLASLDPDVQNLLRELMTGVSQQVEQTRRNDLAMFENMQAESSKALFEAQQAAEEAYLARSALSTQLSEKEADLDAARQQMQQLSAQSADYQSSQEQQTEQIAAMFQELQDSKTTLTQMQQELEDTRKSSQAALFEANAALDKAVSDAREAAFAEGHEQATTATKSWFHGSASALNPIETDKGRFYPLDYLEKNPHMRSQLASERGVPGMLNMQDATSSPSTDDSSEEQGYSEELLTPGARALRQLDRRSNQPRPRASRSFDEADIDTHTSHSTHPTAFTESSLHGHGLTGHQHPYGPARTLAGDLHTTAMRPGGSLYPGAQSGYPVVHPASIPYGPAAFSHQTMPYSTQSTMAWPGYPQASAYPHGYGGYHPGYSAPTMPFYGSAHVPTSLPTAVHAHGWQPPPHAHYAPGWSRY